MGYGDTAQFKFVLDLLSQRLVLIGVSQYDVFELIVEIGFIG